MWYNMLKHPDCFGNRRKISFKKPYSVVQIRRSQAFMVVWFEIFFPPVKPSCFYITQFNDSFVLTEVWKHTSCFLWKYCCWSNLPWFRDHRQKKRNFQNIDQSESFAAALLAFHNAIKNNIIAVNGIHSVFQQMTGISLMHPFTVCTFFTSHYLLL